jgi:hypothetical protein
MNIFQRFELKYGYPASAYVHDNSFNYESYEAIRESASLRNWLWDCYSIWVVVRHSESWVGMPMFTWMIDFPKVKDKSNGKAFKTAQQAYADAFEIVFFAHDFLEHKNFNQ